MHEPWGSPLDRAAEALALHDTKLDPAMGKIAWRTVSPLVREAYTERARVVLEASGAVAVIDSAIGLADHWAPKTGPDAEAANREIAELRALANQYGMEQHNDPRVRGKLNDRFGRTDAP